MLRPVIVTPTYKGPAPFYVDCLAELLSYWSLHHLKAPPYRSVASGDPAAGMYIVVKGLQAAGVDMETDGVLCVEHDHAFGPDDAEHLLVLAQTVPDAVVGGLYYQRMTDDLVGVFDEGASTRSTASDLHPMKRVGLGFCWIPWSVFRTVKEPWFDPRWHEMPGGIWVRDSHDTAFCRDARKAGVPIYGVILKGLLHQHDVPPRGVKIKA